jgi:hypothetical protein
MNVRHSRLSRLLVLTVVVSMPLLGMAGVASAKNPKNLRGSAAWCANHPGKANKPVCANSGAAGGGTGTSGGTGGAPVDITVTADPNPLVETGQSEIHAVIQVETLPSFAGDVVSIGSSQLVSSCGGGVSFESVRTGMVVENDNNITTVLDDDGNATVVVDALNCAPGTSVIEADLAVAPYLTALTELVASPPVPTAAGLTGVPNFEVETGDTSNTTGNGPSGNSDVYAVFYVEDNPVYAEQVVEISSAQLEARCGQGWIWEATGNVVAPATGNAPGGGTSLTMGTGVNTTGPAQTTLDDDGNAVFVFKGVSCAAGDSQVIADVLSGTHDTFTFDYTIDPPAPTI